jgi:phosphoglycerate dehydrogenase-like enzyme
VIELLEPFETRILLYDPYVDDAHAVALGARKTDLDELMSTADVISLHCPANDDTHHIVNRDRLASMGDGTVIINTARGSLIDEAALIDELSTGRLFAFLDVTDPEPPLSDSPLRRLDNVVVTPHIAGCVDNCNRMGELAVEELRRYFAGEPAVYEIRREMLDRIA